MNELAAEWVEKANEDLAVARREMAVVERPAPSAVCFHAQQCVEKMLKALLSAQAMDFPKTHDLGRLADLLSVAPPALLAMRAELEYMTSYAVEFRYPGVTAGKEDARRALDLGERVHDIVLGALDANSGHR